MEEEKQMSWQNMSLEELQDSSIYKSLTETGKKRAGETKESILHFFTTVLFPFLHKNIDSMVMDQISDIDADDFEFLYAENLILSQNTRDSCLAQMQKKGISYTMDYFKYLVAFVHYRELHLCKFIPISVSASNLKDDPDYDPEDETDDWNYKLINDLFEALLFSRVHYLTSGSYLPIVLNVAMYDVLGIKMGHTVGYIFLPDSKGLSWHRIYIDSDGASLKNVLFSQIYPEVEKSIQLAWKKYKDRLTVIQIDNEEFPEQPTLCSYNFQGAFHTCTHWSLIMTLHFLYNYQNQRSFLMNSDIMTKWCKNLEDFARVNRSQIMNIIIDLDLRLNQFLKKTVFDVVDKKNKQNVSVQIQTALWQSKAIDPMIAKYIKQLNILDYFSRMSMV